MQIAAESRSLIRGGLFRLKVPTLVLILSMFLTGGCGMVYEYVLCTVSTYILGNSIEQWSFIMALMLACMATGGFVQKFIADGRLVEKFVLAEIVLALLGGFAPIATFAAYGTMSDHFPFVQYFFIIAIGLLIGIEIPLATRINEKYAPELKSNIANIFGADYVGAFVGAIVWLWLLKRIAIFEISYIIAGFNLTVALLTLAYFYYKKKVDSKVAMFVLIGVCGLGLIYGFTNSNRWNLELEQRLYDEPIVYAKTTKYQRLVMTHNRSINEYRFYINGNLQFCSTDEAYYHELLVHPAMNLAVQHRNVLVLGGGDGLALREILKYRDVQSVTLVDLDPGMIEICSTNPILTKLNANSFADARVHAAASRGVIPEGFRRAVFKETGELNKKNRPIVEQIATVEVFTVDADKFLGLAKAKWDVVIVDLPDPNSVELAKLYSKEFYLKVRRVLADGGVMVVQAGSPFHAKEAYLCVKRTVAAAKLDTLPYHHNIPSFGEWGWVVAWKQADSQVMAKRLSSLKTFSLPSADLRYLTPELFGSSLVFGKGWLESQYKDVSTLMRPIILDRYISEGWKMD